MKHRQSAFTLLEVLIVINILALLMAIGWPAIGRSWESARRLQCQTNLRQLAAAVHSYAASQDLLPPASLWNKPGVSLISGRWAVPGTVDLSLPGPDGWKSDPSRSGVFVALLPYVDQSTLAQQWNYDRPGSAAENAAIRSASISVFLCPSDSSWTIAPLDGAGGGWARSNYAINAGPDLICLAARPTLGSLSLPKVTCRELYPMVEGVRGIEMHPPSVFEVVQVFGSGVAGVNKCFSMADIKDGLSHTIVFDEILRGADPLDRRGTWAMPLIGASITFGHGHWTQGGRPNPPRSTDIIQDGSLKFDPPSDSSRKASVLAHSRSRHPGGVNALLADGSARFLVNETDQKLWTALHTRDAGDRVEDSSLP